MAAQIPTHCALCGRELPERKAGSRGRPRERHDECRNLQKFMNQVHDHLQGIEFADKDHARAIRSELWHMANLINGKVRKAEKA